MAISDDDARKIAEAVWSRQLDSGVPFSAPAAQFVASMYDEIKRPDLLAARIVAALPKGQATGLTYDNVFEAVKSALKAQAAIIAAT